MRKKPVYTCEVCARESIVGREFVRLRDERGSTVVCKTCAGQLGDDAVRARHAAKPILPRPRGERTFRKSTRLDGTTVADLIARLQAMPPDLPVLVNDSFGESPLRDIEDTYIDDCVGEDEFGEALRRRLRVCLISG